MTDRERAEEFLGRGADWCQRSTLEDLFRDVRMEAIEECAGVADSEASDYECDWSSPEFNFASNVAAAIRKLK